MKKPIIAIPLGDPAGIGPEIVVKALHNETIQNTASCIITGTSAIVQKAVDLCNLNEPVISVKSYEEWRPDDSGIHVLETGSLSPDKYQTGRISGLCGQAAFDYVKAAGALALSGKVEAITTPPINKESLRAANIPYIGHTEILADLTNTPNPLTMFEVENLRVFFLTRHLSLVQACQSITTDQIVNTTIDCINELKRIGVAEGTFAIAGLNPHCGEHGLFGTEEETIIRPAVKQLQKLGYNIEGPISADSVFTQALRGKYNAVLSLYHDQGHIATKTYSFEKTISITLGMPILRTSVDHGTGFDIAGKGIASDISMIEAILKAVKYAPQFNNIIS